MAKAITPSGEARPWPESGGLASLEWGLTLAAAGLWVAFEDRPPGAATVVAGLCWGGGWVARRARLGVWTRRTPIDGLLAVYGLASVAAVWAAADGAASGARLGLLLGAVGIFYALINSSPTTTWRFGDGVALAGALFAAYFASQHDWLGQPAKFALIGRVGGWLNAATPQLGLYDPHPNVAATILALCLPLPAAQAWARLRAIRSVGRTDLGLAFSATAGAMMALGLVMTESRGAMLASAAAAGLAAGWVLAQRLPAGRSERRWVFAGGLAVMLAALAAATVWQPDWLGAVVGNLPGPNSAVSRLAVYAQVWRLAQDTPFTGGGLAAFPGLYATHILGIPYLFLTHAHNAYLNVLVEQGVVGALSFGAIFLVGGWAALGKLQMKSGWAPLAGAGAAALAVAALHGLVEGTLVASRAAVLWLVPLGLALWPAVAATESRLAAHGRRGWWVTVAVLGLAAAAIVLSPAGAGRAAWAANMGAVRANWVLLAGFPTNAWSTETETETPALDEAAGWLERGLALSPADRTSHYFLGLIAARRRDFPASVEHLRAAHLADPLHRGVTKALAFSLVWVGEFDAAARLMPAIPEARSEMEVYAWWWTTQQRPDLAQHARTALLAWPPRP
jgi:O-antigen ligase